MAFASALAFFSASFPVIAPQKPSAPLCPCLQSALAPTVKIEGFLAFEDLDFSSVVCNSLNASWSLSLFGKAKY